MAAAPDVILKHAEDWEGCVPPNAKSRIEPNCMQSNVAVYCKLSSNTTVQSTLCD